MDDEKQYQLALKYTSGIGDVTIKHLISYCGSATAVFKSNVNKLSKIPGVGEATARTILRKKSFPQAEETIERALKEQAHILFFTDATYPHRLKHIYDAPSVIYSKGNINFENEKAVAIVGTRNASEYGKEVTEQIVSALKAHDPLIISGLAYGIDIQAHKTALKNNLQTIGVMASGLDIIYPALHKSTAMHIQENGGIITENQFGAKPEAPRFPARNRIIAGLADAIIVVEAAKKGGALITAEIANSYNKDVFAVPGNLNTTYSEGCNNLIKSHKANLLTSVKDLEYIMGWEPMQSPTSANKNLDPSLFENDELEIIKLLQAHKDAMLIDELSWKSQIAVGQLASVLLNLEFKGFVVSLPGKKFKLSN